MRTDGVGSTKYSVLFYESGKILIELGSLVSIRVLALVIKPAVKHIYPASFRHHTLIVAFEIRHGNVILPDISGRINKLLHLRRFQF